MIMADGQLRISIKSSSMFLADSLPVEIRDAQNRLVTRFTGPTSVVLPEGLYTVGATLPGGGRHSQVIKVDAGVSTELVLSRSDADAAGSDDEEQALAGAPSFRGVRPDVPPDVPQATLLGHEAVTEPTQHGVTWVFDPVPEPTETPVAKFMIAGTTVSTSLPVNPRGKDDAERSCVVTFSRRGDGIRVDAGFARQRRVAWTLEGLIRSANVVSVAELFDKSENLLYDKYRDPPAAALGGLTLHRIGRLPERQQWVENLARDFRWVVDGRVLLAAILSVHVDAGERARGLESLLDAAPGRPLFTDGLALMIQLLRTWPDESGADERRAALQVITADRTTVDWDAMTLTRYGED